MIAVVGVIRSPLTAIASAPDAPQLARPPPGCRATRRGSADSLAVGRDRRLRVLELDDDPGPGQRDEAGRDARLLELAVELADEVGRPLALRSRRPGSARAGRGSGPSGRPAGPAARWPSRPAASAPGSCSGRAGPRTRAGRRSRKPSASSATPSVICQLGIARRRRTAVTAGCPRRRRRRGDEDRGDDHDDRDERPPARTQPAPSGGARRGLGSGHGRRDRPSAAGAPGAPGDAAAPPGAPLGPGRGHRAGRRRLRAVLGRRLGVDVLEPGVAEGRHVERRARP